MSSAAFPILFGVTCGVVGLVLIVLTLVMPGRIPI